MQHARRLVPQCIAGRWLSASGTGDRLRLSEGGSGPRGPDGARGSGAGKSEEDPSSLSPASLSPASPPLSS
eukprot:4679326-Pyramimonas_sp.AAC.1